MLYLYLGKARRLKQAKDEALEEIEKYKQEREKQFKDFEIKVNIKLCLIRFDFIVFIFNFSTWVLARMLLQE